MCPRDRAGWTSATGKIKLFFLPVKLKLAAVSDWIYQRIPAVLKLLFSEKDIEKLIESALEEAKKAWGTNGNLAAYIDECYYLSITPQEAEKAATKLNDEPRTIAPGT